MNPVHSTLTDPRTGEPLRAIGYSQRSGRPIWPVMGASPDDPSSPEAKAGGKEGDTPKTFTQEELDRIVGERVQRERQTVEAKYKDYPDLKKQAEGARTAEQQIADLQNVVAQTQQEALRARVQASFGISDEDAELYLTGTDKETLERQAKRLKELADERVRAGGRVPGEGGNGRPVVTEEKAVVRTLFGSHG